MIRRLWCALAHEWAGTHYGVEQCQDCGRVR